MNTLTKFKHWQIFIIIGGLIGLFVAFSEIQVDLGFISSRELRPLFGVLGVIAMFIWILSIGYLTNNIPSNPYRFKNGLFIFATILCIIGYSTLHITPIFTDRIPNLGLMTAPLTPFTFFGVVYIFYNVPRSLKSLEVGRKVGFGECIVDALLLFFAPIGVWIIQPKINKIGNDISK
ncbi:MAG: hypothetical protein AB7S48_17330 [Bacteroidales bacterium]